MNGYCDTLRYSHKMTLLSLFAICKELTFTINTMNLILPISVYLFIPQIPNQIYDWMGKQKKTRKFAVAKKVLNAKDPRM